MRVCRASIKNLADLVGFTAAEAQEAEGATKDLTQLEIEIKAAMEDC